MTRATDGMSNRYSREAARTTTPWVRLSYLIVIERVPSRLSIADGFPVDNAKPAD